MSAPGSPVSAAGFSLHEQACELTRTVLLEAQTDAGPRVERSRRDAISADELACGPVLTIARAPGAYSAWGDAVDEAEIAFTVACWAKGEDWEVQADALHLQAHAALLASPALAGLLRGLACTQTEPADQEGEERIGRITATYQARAFTARASLARAAGTR